MKYSRKQIQDSINHWKSILESMEQDEMLQEGFFKKAKDAVANTVKAAKEGMKDTVSSVKEKVHDTFAANEGIKKLLACISDGSGKMNPKISDASKTFFKVKLPGTKTTVAVKGFALFKNKLVLQIANVKEGRSLTDFQEFVQEKKIKKLSSSADGIVICITKEQKEKDKNDFYDAFTKEIDIDGTTAVISTAKINGVTLNKDIIFTFDETKEQKKNEEASNAAFM